MNVSEIMNKNVVTIKSGASVVDAAREMERQNVGMLPVISNGSVEGIITDRDIVVSAIARNAPLDATLVSDIMAKQPITVKKDHKADDVAVLMSENQVRRVVVVDEKGEPVGVVSLGDLGIMLNDKEAVANVLAEVGKRAMK
jgi:CBS domain-containing protein